MRSRLPLMFSDFTVKFIRRCCSEKTLIFILLVFVETAFSFDPHYVVVAKDGSGDFKTITAAVDSLPMFNYERVIIFIKNGVYHEKIRVDQDYITLEGESKDSTIIEYPQLRTDWIAHKDLIGSAVVNIHGDDVILRNLTVRNTQPVVGPHAFAVYDDGTKTVIVNCNLFSKGADTVSPWNYKTGMYYMADCSFSGSVDFVCPRGWCFVKNSKFYEEKKGSASIWHAGSYDKNQKFVLENCSFDGVKGFTLGRHHLEAQFFLLNCTFSKNMADTPIYRVVYHYSEVGRMDSSWRSYNAIPFDSSNIVQLNRSRPFNWGERDYFYNCKRDGGDYPWFADNLNSAAGHPTPASVTPSWTFGGKWNPESTVGPGIIGSEIHDRFVLFFFSEPVTVIGLPILKSGDGRELKYDSGAGTNTLRFDSDRELEKNDLKGLKILGDAKIVGTIASVQERDAKFGASVR
jgi:pectinesterase